MTSASMPSSASISAAFIATPTMMLNAVIVTCLPTRSILARPSGRMKSIRRAIEGVAVQDFVFQHDDRVGVADRSAQQPFGVGRRPRRHDLQPRHMRVPTRIALRVLGSDARCSAVGTAEHDRAAHLSARHIQRLRGRVDDVVHRLHGKVECHELDDWLQTIQRGTDSHAGKPVFSDRRIDHPLGSNSSSRPWLIL